MSWLVSAKEYLTLKTSHQGNSILYINCTSEFDFEYVFEIASILVNVAAKGVPNDINVNGKLPYNLHKL